METLRAWPDAAALADLRELTERATDRRQKILGLRGLIRVTGLKSARPAQGTLKLYQQAWDLAERDQEKKLILSGVGSVSHLDALQWVGTHLTNPAIKAEAEVAAVQIGLALAKTHRADAVAVLRKVQQQTSNRELKKKIRDALK